MVAEKLGRGMALDGHESRSREDLGYPAGEENPSREDGIAIGVEPPSYPVLETKAIHPVELRIQSKLFGTGSLDPNLMQGE
jgi:hypothetical protein